MYSRLVHVEDFGPAPSPSAATPPALLQALAALAADGNGGAIEIASAQAIPGSTSIPSNVSVRFVAGGSVNIPSGAVLTINGPLVAPPVQIFTGAGTVVFGASALKRGATAEWWGITGTADQIGIAKAMAAVATSPNGGLVQLLAKDYVTLSTLFNTYDKVDLRGAGRRQTRIVNQSLNSDAIDVSGLNSQVTFEDIQITGTLAGRTAGAALSISNCGTGVILNRVYLNGHIDGLFVGTGVYELTFSDSMVTTCTGSHVHVDPGSATAPVDLTLTNLFIGNPSGSSAIGVNIAAVAGVYARGMNVTGGFQYAGLMRHTAVGQSVDWGFWTQCLFDGASVSGLLIDSSPGLSATVVRSQRFVDCWFASNGKNGLEINCNTAGPHFDGITFTSCRFQHNTQEGSHCYGSLTTLFNIRFLDCTWSANSATSSGTYNGALFDGGFSFFEIRGGKAGLEAQGNGTDYEKTQNFGIAITSSACGNFDISDIDTTGNINAAGIINAASATSGNWTVKNVRGYNPRGALGPPAVPAASTDLLNPYGCDCQVFVSGGTSVAVAVAGAATGQASGGFTVPAKSKINLGAYSVAPAWVWIGN